MVNIIEQILVAALNGWSADRPGSRFREESFQIVNDEIAMEVELIEL
jgi:hypothetical protein